jgi:hypothetical protein
MFFERLCDRFDAIPAVPVFHAVFGPSLNTLFTRHARLDSSQNCLHFRLISYVGRATSPWSKRFCGTVGDTKIPGVASTAANPQGAATRYTSMAYSIWDAPFSAMAPHP